MSLLAGRPVLEIAYCDTFVIPQQCHKIRLSLYKTATQLPDRWYKVGVSRRRKREDRVKWKSRWNIEVDNWHWIGPPRTRTREDKPGTYYCWRFPLIALQVKEYFCWVKVYTITFMIRTCTVLPAYKVHGFGHRKLSLLAGWPYKRVITSTVNRFLLGPAWNWPCIRAPYKWAALYYFSE